MKTMEKEMINKKRYHIVKRTFACGVNYIDIQYLCGFIETAKVEMHRDPDEYHRLCKRCQKIANG